MSLEQSKPDLVSSMSEEQLREEVRRLSRALVDADRSREDRSGMPMIGGADVCTTCSAHCNVMDEDQAEIARLRVKIADVDARIDAVVQGRVMASTSWLRAALAELRS